MIESSVCHLIHCVLKENNPSSMIARCRGCDVGCMGCLRRGGTVHAVNEQLTHTRRVLNRVVIAAKASIVHVISTTSRQHDSTTRPPPGSLPLRNTQRRSKEKGRAGRAEERAEEVPKAEKRATMVAIAVEKKFS